MDPGTRKKVLRLVLTMEDAGTLEELPHVKKLSGYRDAYRMRIGDYRRGLHLVGHKVQLARLLHRKEVYRFFP